MATPLPVLIRVGPTALPVHAVVGPTPIPVRAVIGPSPVPVTSADAVNPWFAYVFPTIGAIAAVITVIGIIVAVFQLKAANTTLRLMQLQDQEARRKPQLSLVERTQNTRRYVVQCQAVSQERVALHLAVVNTGKTATGLIVELLLPHGVKVQEDAPNAKTWVLRSTHAVIVNRGWEVAKTEYRAEFPDLIMHEGPPVEISPFVPLVVETLDRGPGNTMPLDTYIIEYRLISQGIVFPTDQEYLTIEFVPVRGVHTFMSGGPSMMPPPTDRKPTD